MQSYLIYTNNIQFFIHFYLFEQFRKSPPPIPSISIYQAKFGTTEFRLCLVLRGNSATIQTLSLDKDGYLAGDTANINLLWSPSADSFSGSRAGSGSTLSPVTMTVSVVNSKGFSCISPISQVIKESSIDLAPKIKRECKNPKVTAELKDDKGNVLAQKVLSFETKTDLSETNNSSNKILILIFGILIVVGLALYFINLKKKQNETIIQ